MKPIRLEVKGFTAFRDQVILDFEGRRLFVITGPTGAGKSSLLDAMTWALFGQVPRVGASVGQLISQGETSMHALLEFVTRGRRYRVARRAFTKGPSAVRLERRDSTGEWVSVADNSADVKVAVERLLGMDYRTFTRTMVLPQGAFDAFLRGEPAQRREILSNLIGLEIYEPMRQISYGRATGAKVAAESLRAQLTSLDLATPERLATVRADEVAARAHLATLATRFEALRGLADCWRSFEGARQAASEATAEAERTALATHAAKQALSRAQQAATDAQRQAATAEADRAALAYDRGVHEALRVQVALLDQRDAALRDVEATRAAVAAAERDHATADAAAVAAVRASKQAERALQQARTKAESAAAQVVEAAAAAVAARDQRQAEALALAAEVVAARKEAQESQARTLAIEQIAARLAGEAETERLASLAHAEAVRDAKAATRDAAAATKAHTAAERVASAARDKAEAARRANAAADLSRGLKKGDRCPICGDILTAAPKHAKADFDAAERAVAEAERILRESAMAASTAASASAVAAERVEARADALGIAAARRAEIEGEVKALGVTALDLPKQAQREAKAAEQAEARANRAEQAAERASTAARAFDVALGPLETTPPAGEPAASPAALTRAIEVAAVADLAARTAASAFDSAKHEADAAQREVALREQALRTAREHDRGAAERLAVLGTVEADSNAVRSAFAAAEQAVARAAALDAAIAKARAACAAAEASVVAAGTALDVAQTGERERATRAAEQRQAEQHAVDALTKTWRDVLGEGAPSKAALATAQREHQAEQQEVTLRAGALGQAVVQAEQQAAQAATSVTEIATHEARHRLATELHTELRSDHFVDFLLSESLELLARDASLRLMQFSTGRYELQTAKGDFLVLDHQNGDERRSVKTLSGGETFLASLALALSLSEHLPEISGTGGAVALESLFLDEGFGSLDAESLDLAVQGLEALVDGNRMVGVISHVEELSERLPSRIHVEKHAHTSLIRPTQD